MKNITFKQLSISNFLSIGKEIKVNFTNGIHVITGYNLDKEDGNGVGKSTIVDAFFFALFGDTLRDLKKEEIVNNIAKKNCKVVLDFDIEKNGVTTNYKIDRGLAPSKCSVLINNKEDKTLSTIPATNEYILNLINSTQAVFKNTITMSLNSAKPFMSQKKNEKRDFIEGILRLELFKVMKKVAKEEHDLMFKDYEFTIKSYEENIRNITMYSDKKEAFERNRKEKIKYQKERLATYKKELTDLDTTLIPIDENALEVLLKDLRECTADVMKYDQDYNNTTRTIAELSTDLKHRTNSSEEIAKKLLSLKQSYDQIPEFPTPIKGLDQCNEYLIAEKKNIDDFRVKAIELERDVKDLQAKIKNIKEVGSFCDKCNRPYPENDVKKNEEDIAQAQLDITNKNKEKELVIENGKQSKVLISKAELYIQLLNYSAERKGLTSKITELETKLAATKEESEKIQIIRNDIKARWETHNQSVNELKQKKDRNESTKRLMNNTVSSIKNCEQDIGSLEIEVNEFEDLIIKSNAKKAELELKIEDYKEKVAIYDIIKFVVSDEGVKSYIIKKLLGILNERIAYYLLKMEAPCVLTFNEYFDDKIINDRNIECSYDNFSMGERKRIDLACLFAFMDLRRIQGDVTFNVTFYDELLDSALSKDGSEKVFQILKERLDKYNEMAYIITHRRENLKNPLIDDIIYLEKLGGITRLGEFKK